MTSPNAPRFPPGSVPPATHPPHATVPARASVPVAAAPAPTPAPSPAAAPSPATRRLTGIDVARCVAILGMLVAHLGTGHHYGERGWGADWMWIVDGRSSALFATLAGVSIALMSRRAATADVPLAWRGVRVKIAVRAGLILPIGIVLQLLGTPVAVILPTYAVLFVMSLPVLRLPGRWLLGLAALAALMGPLVVLGLRQATTGQVGPTLLLFGFGVGELVWGYYPALVWIAYLLVGMVLGRLALHSRRVALALTGGGLALAAAGYGLGVLLARTLSADTAAWPGVLLATEPHSDAAPEVIGNIGVALAVTGCCLLLASWRPAELVLSPLAATGSMSLTVYTAQLLVIAALGPESVWYPESNTPLLVLAIASVVFATAWRALLGRGPLERALAAASDAAARGATRPRTPPAGRTPPW